jgi:phosphatidylinositol alpha-1,6-mannosyltransferase
MTAPPSPSILFIVPDLLGAPGGIARYCQAVVAALQAQHPAPALSVIALHDAPTQTVDGGYRYLPCGGSRRRFVQTVIQECLRLRPTVVLGGHVHLAPVVAWWCRLTNTPFVQFLYGIEVWDPLPSMRRWAVNQAQRMIAISRFSATRACEINGFDPARVQVLYNCLDPAFAAPPSAMADSHSLLTVTRLSRADSYKGVDVVLKALPLIRQSIPTVRYHIVGDGDARGDLETLAKELGVADVTCFHGRVSDETLRDLYAHSTVFVMPSRMEGFGFVFLEAMAQGTPAIGGNQDATTEVIVDGETGYTIDPTSPQAVAGAVLTLLQDSALRHTMSRNARAHAHARFGFEQFRTDLWTYLAPYLSATDKAA